MQPSIPKKRKLEEPGGRQHNDRIKVPRTGDIEVQKLGVRKDGREKSFVYAISDNHDEMIWCKVGQVLVEMMIDSGSKFNIIDESTWKYLKERSAYITNVKASDKRLCAYAQRGTLEILCTFDAEIRVVDGSRKPLSAEFYVVKGGKQNLLGRDTAKELGVLLIGLPSTVEETVQHVADSPVEKFPTIKGIKLRIEIDESVTPVVQHVRRVPIALRQQVEDQINRLLRSGIIEKVDKPSPWVSPMESSSKMMVMYVYALTCDVRIQLSKDSTM
nr:uncharacterized protein LOC115262208 [Aedes albopictus]